MDSLTLEVIWRMRVSNRTNDTVACIYAAHNHKIRNVITQPGEIAGYFKTIFLTICWY